MTNKFKRLILAISLNLTISAGEAFFGMISGSLVLIADALHNLLDTISLIVSAVAIKIATRPATSSHTFGLRRAETLASFLNSFWLFILTILLIFQATKKIFQPAEINPAVMLPVAITAFAVNLFSALILKKDSVHNLNIRASYLHLLADSAFSAAVILTALSIHFWHFLLLDPLLTILFSLFILQKTLPVLKSSLRILMEANPLSDDLIKIKEQIEKIPGVKEIHHIHLWNITESELLFEAHLQVDVQSLEQAEAIRLLAEKTLSTEFGIMHTTLQLESITCSDEKNNIIVSNCKK